MTWHSILKSEIKKGFANMADTNLSDNQIEIRNNYLENIFLIARHLSMFNNGKWYDDKIRIKYEVLRIPIRSIRYELRNNPKANKENSNLESLLKSLDRRLSEFATVVTNFYNSQRGKKILRSFMGRNKSRQEKFLKEYNEALNHLKRGLMEGDFSPDSQTENIGYYSDLFDNPTVYLDPQHIGDGKKGLQTLVEVMAHEGGHRASRKLNYPYSEDGEFNILNEETLAHIIENPDKKDRLKRLVNILGRDDILEFVENHPDIKYTHAFNSMHDDYQDLLRERNEGKLTSLEERVEDLVEEVNAKNDAKFGKSMGWQDTLKASCMAHKMGTPCSCEKCGSTTKAKKYSKKQIEAFDKDGNGVPFEPKDMKLLGKE